MAPKRILLMYISEDSGHHRASLAIEGAIRKSHPEAATFGINAFNYTNPILEKVINRAYMGVIQKRPEIWDYLYDNPRVLAKTRRLREMIHRFNSTKLKVLIDDFRPDAVVCTQAFPCGMVADYKRTYGLALPIVGTLTDYAPHSYWIYNNVDYYVVPSEETARKLISSGVAAERVKLLGIPIDIKFQAPTDRETVASSLGLNTKEPTVLIMGGTQGLGPIRELVPILDCLPQPMQMIVVSGTNKKLYQWLIARQKTFRKKVVIYGFAQNIDDLMGLASVIVTKPGGITTAEALAKGLPMVILNPLPGQEAMNTAFLIKEEAAVKAQNVRSCVVILEELLYHESKLRSMGANARRVAKPNSANDITDLIFKL